MCIYIYVLILLYFQHNIHYIFIFDYIIFRYCHTDIFINTIYIYMTFMICMTYMIRMTYMICMTYMIYVIYDTYIKHKTFMI